MSRGATPRQIEAQAAVDAATDGGLAFVGSYRLQRSAGMYRIGVPPLLPDNSAISKGSPVGVYLDLDRGIAVYDFQVGDEYDRGEGLAHVDE